MILQSVKKCNNVNRDIELSLAREFSGLNYLSFDVS